MTPAGAPEIRVFPDLESMSRAAADLIVSLVLQGSASSRPFTLVLSGGSTPKKLYKLLASVPYREAVPWSELHVFWADERCVPEDHPESNFKLAYDGFLSGVPLSTRNIHRIRGEEEPGKAAEAYEDQLRYFFKGREEQVFDLVLLGAGEDGHTASLFPGSMLLREKKRLALPVYIDPPKRSRVTLTLPVLNNAARVLFLVSGHRKARIVHEIIEDGNPKGYPAGLVRPVHGSITWMLDREAAGALTDQLIKRC